MAANTRFENKVVVETGGCKGIGKACVDVFLENGAKVTVLDIDEQNGKCLYFNGNTNVCFIKCDTSKEDQVKDALETVVRRFYRIDCLINNAGILAQAKPYEDISLEEFQKTIDVNLIGYFLMTKHCLRHLRVTKGNIINIASSTAHLGYGGSVMYAASNGGVLSMTKNCAIEEAKNGVRVNSVSPGMTRTSIVEEFERSVDKRTVDTMKDFNLLRRFADPREIALTCLFLAGDGTYFNGNDLTPNGGIDVGIGVRSVNM